MIINVISINLLGFVGFNQVIVFLFGKMKNCSYGFNLLKSYKKGGVVKYRILGLLALLSLGIGQIDAAKSFGNRLKSIFSATNASTGSGSSVRAQPDTPSRSIDSGFLRYNDKVQVAEGGETVSSEVIPDAAPVLQHQQDSVAKKPAGRMSWLTESVPVTAINYAYHKLERSAIGTFKPKDTKAQKAASQRLDAAKMRLDQSLATAKALPQSVKKRHKQGLMCDRFW